MTRLQALLQLCHLPFLVSAILQPPTNLKLYSESFQHILTWEDPNNETLIYYHVEYSKDYNMLMTARDCSNITTRLCDLTKDFTDIFESYRPQVHSFTHNDTSNTSYLPSTFSPYADTIVGPPIVNIVACDNCIELSIHPPISYLWSEAEQRNVTMLSDFVYPSLDYTIHLVPSTGEPIRMKDVRKENFSTLIPSLLPNTNYCVSVTASGMEPNKSEASPMKCVITKASQVKGDRKLYFIIIFGITLLIGLLLIVIVLHQTGFIGRKKIFTPNVLKSPPKPNIFFNGNNEINLPVSFISMEIRSTENEDGYANRPRPVDNCSYIANNADNRAEDQQESRSKYADSSIEEGISEENLAVLDITTLELSEDPVSQDMVSSAEDNILKEHPTVIAASDRCMKGTSENTIIGAVITGNVISNTANNINDSSNLSFNGSEIFKIDLHSVSIADPEVLWKSCKNVVLPKEETDISVSLHIDGDPLDIQQFRLFPSVLQGDAPRMVTLVYNNEQEDTLDNDDSNEHFASDYIKR